MYTDSLTADRATVATDERPKNYLDFHRSMQCGAVAVQIPVTCHTRSAIETLA